MTNSERLRAILGNLISITKTQGMGEAETAAHIAEVLIAKYTMTPINGATAPGEPFEENDDTAGEMIVFGSMEGVEETLKGILVVAKKAFVAADISGTLGFAIDISGPVNDAEIKVEYTCRIGYGANTEGKFLQLCLNEMWRRVTWNKRNASQLS